ncbi:peptidoglycan-associated lipoprotein Pal [Novosphingobium sp. FSY-8]|uniref:Peptidoglycan-associated protein n=1 Tax=Novosphingobium ovatum TaxID=1908523 RepID=A0ABW9X9F1_9SPHN|nr:peptidoglycan-associated lipoprotein Pal [Novosphingobium ovatum]NBC35157.1 peptidoglycan-associated lipoprotein Pal [Novosphingobium ovatum]
MPNMPQLARRHGALVALTVSALALAACASTPKELPPPPVAVASSTVETPPQTPPGPAEGSAAHYLATMMGRDTVYFAYDKYNIDPVAAASLQAQAQWLMRYAGKRATIEGHADERGTRDYNIALGERRATAAKNYLVSLGVDAARLTVVSYGKDRPVALGSDEASWAKNRRAVTVVID